MPAKILPLTASPSQGESGPSTAPPAEQLLIDIPRLAEWTSLSVRHLRRLDSSGDLPGRITVGRRVLFRTDIIREWVRLGCPEQNRWAALGLDDIHANRCRRGQR